MANIIRKKSKLANCKKKKVNLTYRTPQTTQGSKDYDKVTLGQTIDKITKFFKWLYNQDEPDTKKRLTPPCIRGIRSLPSKEKTAYKPFPGIYPFFQGAKFNGEIRGPKLRPSVTL